jgi:hypothetical protein
MKLAFCFVSRGVNFEIIFRLSLFIPEKTINLPAQTDDRMLFVTLYKKTKSMYRQILIPTEQNNVIPVTIPREWYGRQVEIIVFPISKEERETEKKDEDEFMKLCGSWKSDRSAEEIIADIRSSRTWGKTRPLLKSF